MYGLWCHTWFYLILCLCKHVVYCICKLLYSLEMVCVYLTLIAVLIKRAVLLEWRLLLFLFNKFTFRERTGHRGKFWVNTSMGFCQITEKTYCCGYKIIVFTINLNPMFLFNPFYIYIFVFVLWDMKWKKKETQKINWNLVFTAQDILLDCSSVSMVWWAIMR